ncbi:MAG: class I SAM-dependent methyltransferase [Chloroflexota bacterium]|nr:class I SAM-dependent methyltransferase [Chloroflexota bacterium]
MVSDDRGIKDKAFYVRRMFASIARRYDLLNSVLSLGRDRSWRRFAVSLTEVSPGGLVLDVAAGTGKIAYMVAGRNPQSTVVGVDFCPEMLAVARKRSVKVGSPHPISQIPLGPPLQKGERVWAHFDTPLRDTPNPPGPSDTGRTPLFRRSVENTVGGRVHFVQGDALRLPFPDNTFDCITIGFALRNVVGIEDLFRELERVAKPGGKLVSLELTRPSVRLLKPLHKLYIISLLRCVGGIVSGKWEAYTYLPKSILDFPSPQGVKKVMEDAGWREVGIYRLTFGIATVQTGIKGVVR